MKKVNRGTIIDMVWWYTPRQHSGYNRTRAKQKLLSKPRREVPGADEEETQKSLQKFLEPTKKTQVIYTDNSLVFGKACEDPSWNHCTSTLHRSESNGIAERAVRRVKEGTSAVLLECGLGNEWWSDSMECSCFLRNIQDLLSVGKTPCERRFGMPFNGPVIPFGAVVEYHPIHQFGSKVLQGIFQLEEMDASELHARRHKAKKVFTPQRSGNFIFPVADGTASENIHLYLGATGTR